MKKCLLFLLMVIGLAVAANAQFSLGGDLTVSGAYGLAQDDLALLGLNDPGLFVDKKNAFYLNGNLVFGASDPAFYDLAVKLNLRSKVGSAYVPLQSPYVAGYDSAILLDSAWARGNVMAALGLAGPFELKVKLGKYYSAAKDFSLSAYHLEYVQNMVKSSTAINAGLEAVLALGDDSQPVTLALEGLTGLGIDEAIVRLYDTDGSISSHGLVVLSEFDSQYWAALKLNNLRILDKPLSAELEYAYNGASIYSGSSLGCGIQYSIGLLQPTPAVEGAEAAPAGPSLDLPIDLAVAWYEKNIDAMAGSSGYAGLCDTTDFRSTLRVGGGVGLRYKDLGVLEFDVNLSGAWSNVNHIYRDPLNLIALGLDTEFRLGPSFFVGGGLVLGSLTEASWKTAANVASTVDDYRKTFSLAENLGWEAYLGLNIITNLQIIAGYYDYSGLSMTQGLRRIKDGETKFLQPGKSVADQAFKTAGIYLSASIKK
jgi:hypothetical protein